MRGLSTAEAAVLRRALPDGLPQNVFEGEDATEIRERLVAQGRMLKWDELEGDGMLWTHYRTTERGRLALQFAVGCA